MSFAVLLVCTGNLCRSPAAEVLLRRALAHERDIEIMSAGTHAMTGAAMHPLTAAALQPIGIDPSAHAAQRLETSMVKVSDLVLCATRQHRGAVLDFDPGGARKTFTILEFARLVTGVDVPARQPLLVRDEAAVRRNGPGMPEDDLHDPVHGDLDDHVRMVEVLRGAVDTIGASFSAQPMPVTA